MKHQAIPKDRTFAKMTPNGVVSVAWEDIKMSDIVKVTSDDFHPGWQRVVGRDSKDDAFVVIPFLPEGKE